MTCTVNRRVAVILTLAAELPCNVAAEYPERALTAIVPFAAGSSNDGIARRISPHLAKALGQQIVIENRGGADGRIGIEAAAKAAPDGYTLLFSGGAVALIPALRRNVAWDPVKNIQPVAELGTIPYAIAVNPNVPAHNVGALIKLAAAQPGRLNASAGGNSSEMSVALFRLKTGIARPSLTRVPASPRWRWPPARRTLRSWTLRLGCPSCRQSACVCWR